MLTHAASLRIVKLSHTLVWAFFAAAIIAIPICAWLQQLHKAGVLTGVVAFEVLVLAVNGWRCPLTAVAAKYTEDRRDNFDIYLPAWLARHNKAIFGVLYVVGVVITAVLWTRS